MKETQEINLNATIDVPTPDGGSVKKRIMDLTAADIKALADQRQAREAQAGQQARPDDKAPPDTSR
jgi:hypothetical protein